MLIHLRNYRDEHQLVTCIFLGFYDCKVARPFGIDMCYNSFSMHFGAFTALD